MTIPKLQKSHFKAMLWCAKHQGRISVSEFVIRAIQDAICRSVGDAVKSGRVIPPETARVVDNIRKGNPE